MPEPKPSAASVAALLQTLGADVVDAVRVASMWVQEEKGRSPTFLEVYGGGSIVQEAENQRRNLGVKGIGAFDLRTKKPDGTSWDFSRKADRALAREYIAMHKPRWIIGSPPCTAFSSWQNFNFHAWTPERSPAGCALDVCTCDSVLSYTDCK